MISAAPKLSVLQRRTTLVIGVGNEFRRDDAVGLLIARELERCAPPGVTVTEQSGEGAALIDCWKGVPSVLIVDAVSSGGVPGTVYQFDARKDRIPSQFFHYSTHAFSVAEAIELARKLRWLPPRIVLYGIEGESFAPGLGLSPRVEAARRVAMDEILAGLKAVYASA